MNLLNLYKPGGQHLLDFLKLFLFAMLGCMCVSTPEIIGNYSYEKIVLTNETNITTLKYYIIEYQSLFM